MLDFVSQKDKKHFACKHYTMKGVQKVRGKVLSCPSFVN